MSTYGTKPAILSVVDPFTSNYIPGIVREYIGDKVIREIRGKRNTKPEKSTTACKCTLPNFPQPLQELYDEKYVKLTYVELLKPCEKVEIVVTKGICGERNQASEQL